MTVTATYLSDLGRVRVAFTAAPAGSDYAVIEKSLDGITWTTVRGGDVVPVVGSAGKLDDYEFDAGVSNTYRVSYVDTGLTPTFVAAGTAATGNNASVVPGAPAGLAVGDLKLILASIRNSGAGSVVTPAGWTKVAESGNLALLARVHQAGDTPPTVTFTGGVVNTDTLAQMACFRNSQAFPTDVHGLLNGSAQNVLMSSITQIGRGMILYLGWKQDDFTSSSTPTFATKIGDVSSTAGDDAGMFWDFFSEPDGNAGLPFGGDTITITGGAAAISRSIVVQFPAVAYAGQETASITPTLTSAWFKVPARPSLNTPVTISWDGTISRPSRAGLFEVLGRTEPVAVTDVQGSRRLTLTFITQSVEEANDLDRRLSSGEPVLIQAPTPNASVPTLYAILGDITQTRPANTAKRRYFTIPLTEVAAPGSTVYADTYTYADVVADYATYADVIAGVATYSDLIDKISDNEVVVP
ncbi:hypothetical protein ACWEF6_01945 [Amycolatopsis sp. NPDC004772]